MQGRSEGAYPLAKVGDISRASRTGESVLSTAGNYVDEADLTRLKAKPIPPGSILFAKIGEAIRQNHRVIAGRPLLIDNNAMAAIPSDRIESRYLYHFLRTVDFYRLASATTVPALRKSDLEKLKVPLPPLQEQQRIAEILDKADALRAKRRTAIARLEHLPQSIFLDMFGDPATNPKGFPTRPLASLVREDDTINYGVVQPGDDLDDGIPLVRVGDLLEGRVSHASLKRIAPSIEAAYKRSRLRGDEILVSCVGSVGVVAAADESVKGFNIARAVARIPIADSIERSFIIEYLKSSWVQRYFVNELRTVSQPTLNIKQLSETRVFVPPIDLQRHFTRRAAAVETLKGTHRACLGELDALFGSIQYLAFRGDL
jgi:type I restriction enzyme S subunit